MTQIREWNGTTDDPVTTGIGVLATFGYDSRGRRISLTRGNNATTTTYAYDDASRLSQLVQNPDGTANDLTLGFAYNPASQIVSNTRSNDAFALVAPAAGAIAAAVDGRNRLTQTSGLNVTHDNRGNVSAIGASSYGYTAENRLVSAPSPMFAYDGLGRLYYRNVSGMWWDYDDDRLTAEIDVATNTILRRWVHGPGVDEPLVQYEGSGTTNRLWLHADERGSIIAQSDSTGAVTTVNRYDEYGAPASGNVGRFQYTGQVWLPEAGLYYYRARMYNPYLPRFMQTDPIGYEGGMNLYAYVGGDPVNFVDPTGLRWVNGPCVTVVEDGSTTCGGHWTHDDAGLLILSFSLGLETLQFFEGGTAMLSEMVPAGTIPCHPQPDQMNDTDSDLFERARDATAAGARATGLLNQARGGRREYHARGFRSGGGYRYEINNRGRRRGSTPITLNRGDVFSSHNHNIGRGRDAWNGMISTDSRRIGSMIRQGNDLDTYQSMAPAINVEELYIGLADSSGIYVWEPHSDLTEQGELVAPLSCP